MSKDPNVGTPVLPRLLTLGLIVFIAYIYFTDYQKAAEPKVKNQTGTVKYLLDESAVKEIEFVGGKTTISLDRQKVEQLSKHLDDAFENDLEVFEIELNKYEPGNPIPEEE